MKRLLNLVSFLLLPHLLCAEGMIAGIVAPNKGWPAEYFPKSQVRMDVAFDWEFKSVVEDNENFDTSIYCRWTNVGAKKIKLLLKDHDDYHGTLDYPWGLAVRITSKAGKVITENPMIKDGWWSWCYLQSQISKLRPGDAIFLKPGESVVRVMPLGSVLMGAADGKLPSEGEYSIEVELYDIHATKSLTLRLGNKKKGESNADELATRPADKTAVNAEPPNPTSKDAPR